MPTEAETAIENVLAEIAAGGVSSTSFSAGSSSQSNLSLGELEKAYRFLAAKNARKRRAFGLVFRQVVPPGSVNDT